MTPDVHQRHMRIKAGRAPPTHAHQGRTRIKALASRPNQGYSGPFHQGRTGDIRAKAGCLPWQRTEEALVKGESPGAMAANGRSPGEGGKPWCNGSEGGKPWCNGSEGRKPWCYGSGKGLAIKIPIAVHEY